MEGDSTARCGWSDFKNLCDIECDIYPWLKEPTCHKLLKTVAIFYTD